MIRKTPTIIAIKSTMIRNLISKENITVKKLCSDVVFPILSEPECIVSPPVIKRKNKLKASVPNINTRNIRIIGSFLNF
jgi:hypothetical protein